MLAKRIDRLADTLKRSKFLQQAQKIRKEEGIVDTPEDETCPVCGAKLLHIEGGIDMLGNWGIIFFLIAILSAFAAAAITLVFDVVTFNDSRRKEDDSEKF